MHFAVLGDVELPYNACMLALLNDKSEKHDVLCSIINHDFVLEEDGDSGYGESPTLLYGYSVRTSKEQIVL